MNDKKNGNNSSSNNIFLIILIIILGISTYHYFTKSQARLSEDEVLKYIKDNMQISDIINIYGKEELYSYVRNNYSPYEIYEDIVILNEISWDEIASEGYKDKGGEELYEFFDRKINESEQQQKKIEELAQIMRQNGINPDELTEYEFWAKAIELEEKGIISLDKFY